MPIDPQVLRQAAALQLLDDDELVELTAHVDERSFAAGQVIFQAGEQGGAMHVVLSGRVEVFLLDDDRQPVVLNQIGPGEILGELSLFDGDARSALERLFTRKPQAALDILTVMSQNRQDAKDRVRSELDYHVNLKAELEIMELHEKFDQLERRLDVARRAPAG